MKLKEITITNFAGLPGKRVYDLQEPFLALCAKNGAGKSSFLSALRYGLTGIEPEGKIVTEGAPYALVRLVLDNGAICIRRNKDGKNEAAVNGKQVPIKELNRVLGIDNLTKVVSATEVLEAIENKKLIDLITSSFSEDFTFEGGHMDSRIEDLTDRQKQLLISQFPVQPFTVSDIDNAYARVYNERREQKKAVLEAKGAAESCHVRTAPDGNPVLIERELSEARNRLASLGNIEAAKAAHDQAAKAEAQRREQALKIEAEIRSLSANAKNRGAELPELQKKAEQLRNAISEREAALQAILPMIASQKKALEAVGSSVCPLSEKLVCKTDKSLLAKELGEGLNRAEEQAGKLKAVLAKLSVDLKKIEDEYLKAKAETDAYVRVEELRRIPVGEEIKVPPLPDLKDAPALKEQIAALERALAAHKEFARYKELLARFEKERAELLDIEAVLKKLAPSGGIKEEIVRDYLQDLQEVCNLLAGGKAEFLFLPEEGVRVYVRPEGRDSFFSLKSLSGGERAFAFSVLLAMFATGSSMGILLIDRAEEMDGEMLDHLIRRLKGETGAFNHVLIAGVDHQDVKDVLDKHGIKRVNL